MGIPSAIEHEEVKKKKKSSKKRAVEGLATPVDSDDGSIRKKRKVEDSMDSTPTPDLSDSKESRKERKRLKKEKKEKKLAAKAEERARNETSPTPAPAPLSQAEIQTYLTENRIAIHDVVPPASLIPVTDFTHLDVHEHLRASLSKFDKPSPIQACAWGALLGQQDVIGIAETGSGKTLAFGIPAISSLVGTSGTKHKSHVAKSATISVLVIAPTRELAIQNYETLERLCKPFGMGCACVYGGVGKGQQLEQLSRPETRVLIGTPGRLQDLVNDGACNLAHVSYLVLDEADRMLDKGFENDVRRIVSQITESPHRQTAMFSATWPDSVRQLASQLMNNPIRIVVGNDELAANSRVEQVVDVFDDARSKDGRLASLLRKLSPDIKKSDNSGDMHRIIVFALYKKEAARVESNVRRQGYAVSGLHGDLNQEQRLKALASFKEGKTQILVATDVAARGLDIPDVEAVINYSFPLTCEDYIHRIGRTGRGGKSGKSFTFFTGDNHERALAGELARILREGGFDAEPLKKFPMTIKKKEHGSYGAFFRNDITLPAAPQKIKF